MKSAAPLWPAPSIDYEAGRRVEDLTGDPVAGHADRRAGPWSAGRSRRRPCRASPRSVSLSATQTGAASAPGPCPTRSPGSCPGRPPGRPRRRRGRARRTGRSRRRAPCRPPRRPSGRRRRPLRSTSGHPCAASWNPLPRAQGGASAPTRGTPVRPGRFSPAFGHAGVRERRGKQGDGCRSPAGRPSPAHAAGRHVRDATDRPVLGVPQLPDRHGAVHEASSAPGSPGGPSASSSSCRSSEITEDLPARFVATLHRYCDHRAALHHDRAAGAAHRRAHPRSASASRSRRPAWPSPGGPTRART